MNAESSPDRDPGSFRDPAGQIIHLGERVLRIVRANHVPVFASVWANGVTQDLMARGRVVRTRQLETKEASAALNGAVLRGSIVLEHERIAPISYPYEWTFEALRDAAIAHLNLHLDLLVGGLTLSDASAFNMQFAGTDCQHIDLLSLVPYVEGSLWFGYDQFLREFLNPLVVEAATGFAVNDHYRGALVGLRTRDAARLLPLRWKVRPGIAAHVVLPARVEARQLTGRKPGKLGSLGRAASIGRLPKSRFIALLEHLRRLIQDLPAPPGRSAAWANYASANSYTDKEVNAKKAIVAAWAQARKPATVLDLGCNTGAMSEVAFENGVKRIVGLDSDRASLDICWARAKASRLPFLPLHIDLANPSPPQGWRGDERRGISERLCGNGLLALALLHHLVIGRNLPLDEVVGFLVRTAPTGLIEFVPKGDPMIDVLLEFRRDIFPDYSLESFREILGRHASIVSETQVTSTGRCIIEYRRLATP